MSASNLERSYEFSQMMLESVLYTAQADDPVPDAAEMAHIWYSSDDDAFHFVDADGNDTSSVAVTFTAINAQLALADATIDINDQAITGIGGLTLVANANVSCAAGTSAVDLSLGTGTFKTTTGAHTINGAVTLAANKGITAASGTAALDFSAASGVFKTSTGVNTFGGIQAAGATVNLIADPGGSNGAIPVTGSGVCALTIGAGAETGTLAIPAFVGQRITIVADTVGGGTRTITAASAINGAANTTMAFNAVRDQIDLIGITVAGTRAWAILLNISVTLG